MDGKKEHLSPMPYSVSALKCTKTETSGHLRLNKTSAFSKYVHIKTHPANFHQVGHHDDRCCVLLPDHPPEVEDSLLHRALGRQKETEFKFSDFFFPFKIHLEI